MKYIVCFILGASIASIILGWIRNNEIRKLQYELAKAEAKAERYGSQPVFIHREEANVVRIRAQTIIHNEELADDIAQAGKRAGAELRHEISKEILKLCEIKIAEDVHMCSRVIRADLKVIAPKAGVNLEDLFAATHIKSKGQGTMVGFDICGGNPGALQFLMDAYRVDMFKAEAAFQRMQDNNITGTKLYMLWNDCCGRDTKLALQIAHTAPIDKIAEHINYEGGRGFPFTEEELTAIC